MLVAIPAGTGILRNIPNQHCNPVSHDSSSLRRRPSETGLDLLFTKREIWGHPGRQIKASQESGSTLKDVSLRELPRSLIPSDTPTVSSQNPDMSPDKTGCDGEVGLGHSSAWWYHKGKRGQDARVSGLAETWVHKERAAGPGMWAASRSWLEKGGFS